MVTYHIGEFDESREPVQIAHPVVFGKSMGGLGHGPWGTGHGVGASRYHPRAWTPRPAGATVLQSCTVGSVRTRTPPGVSGWSSGLRGADRTHMPEACVCAWGIAGHRRPSSSTQRQRGARTYEIERAARSRARAMDTYEYASGATSGLAWRRDSGWVVLVRGLAVKIGRECVRQRAHARLAIDTAPRRRGRYLDGAPPSSWGAVISPRVASFAWQHAENIWRSGGGGVQVRKCEKQETAGRGRAPVGT
ncbi:hypothetical protein JB92DRAFT_1667876 [Gautieria morchelliformis]|nr:hypothetical protein JB92DRAFT_1667876 [Gautieria morchelliformis]